MRVIGLDVGEKRIGVARANSSTRIAIPIGFIDVNGTEWDEIIKLSKLHNTEFFVIGLPRSNEGNETAQSMYVRQFAKTLIEKIPGAKIRFQDESFTSVVAEERLKARRKAFSKGEIDAEAAAIILQDFLENLSTATATQNDPSLGEVTPGAMSTNNINKKLVQDSADTSTNNIPEELQAIHATAKKEVDKVKLNSKKAKSKMKKLSFILLPLLFILVIGGVGVFVWAKSMLTAVDDSCESVACEEVSFVVSDGESKALIASNLEEAGLIKNSFVFKTYLQMFKSDINLKTGTYLFNKGMSADDIIAKLAQGVEDKNTFTFTILPGETIYDIKDKLRKLNYATEDIDAAFNSDYDYDMLKERPQGATLEGYLYGETHEFYNTASVSEVLNTFLKGMQDVIDQNALKKKYESRGLSLFEGITLASVVQKEAAPPEQPTVAQVFLSRLEYGMLLGSDVTVSYALDTIDPDRTIYSDNAAALTVDSCYNTRMNGGLPCGPISNPGLSALLAVANPSDTSYLYFLTGDDGLMYYSSTESEHNQNIVSHCQELCNVSL